MSAGLVFSVTSFRQCKDSKNPLITDVLSKKSSIFLEKSVDFVEYYEKFGNFVPQTASA